MIMGSKLLKDVSSDVFIAKRTLSVLTFRENSQLGN